MGDKKRLLLLSLAFYCIANASFVSVAVEGANFRTGPSTSHSIRWDLDKGYPLYVVSKTSNWYKVKDYLGYVGWVHKNVVSSRKSVIIRGKRINLRKGPGTHYQILGKGYKGQIFWVSRRYSKWIRVKDIVTGKVVWIYRSLVWGG